MTRFLATRPFLAAAALVLIEVPAIAAAGLASRSGTVLSVPPLDFWLFLTCAAFPFAAALAVVLMRRRSGLPAARLWLLVPLLVFQTAVQLFVLGIAFAPDRLRNLFVYGARFFKYDEVVTALVLTTLAATLGLLAGQGIGWAMTRSGRWEHVVPVARPSGGPPE